MKNSTAQRRNGIQWTLWSQLDDLDFADDLALLSHTYQQMQEKTSESAESCFEVVRETDMTLMLYCFLVWLPYFANYLTRF